MIVTLLWKDWRQNRPVMIFGAILMVLPYAATQVHRVGVAWSGRADTLPTWESIVPAVAAASTMLTLLWLAALGGNALAGERNDQSADFLAALPVSRDTVMCSRALVALIAGLIPMALNGALFRWAVLREPHSPPAEPFVLLAASGVLILGVAWFFSAFLRSPTIATGAGIAAPLILAGAVWGYEWMVDERLGRTVARALPMIEWYEGLAILGGVVAFAAGCLHYHRRVLP